MKNMNLKFGRFGIILALVLMIGATLPLMAQDEAKIRVQSDPSTAGLFIDGKYVGSAENFEISNSYVVSPGEHTIRLVDPRFEDYETKVTAEAGKTRKFNFKMTAKPAPQPPKENLTSSSAVLRESPTTRWRLISEVPDGRTTPS